MTMRPTPPAEYAGRLEVICGPMFAGKTTELLRRLGADERAVLCKPAHDTRYDAQAAVTHDGRSRPAVPIASGAELMVAARARRVVGIDEAHFFGNQINEPIAALLHVGVRVIVAGLERDHRGRPFDPFPHLLCEADEVLKLAGLCARCGAASIHSQRLTDAHERIVVGGAESYEPRCRACFVPGR